MSWGCPRFRQRGQGNPMKRLPVKRDEPPARPITFRAAEDLGPFELAQLWCDRTAWPIDERTQYDELSELAVMSALAAVASSVAADRHPQRDARGCSPGGGSGCAREQSSNRLRSLARMGSKPTRPHRRWQAGYHGRGVRRGRPPLRCAGGEVVNFSASAAAQKSRRSTRLGNGRCSLTGPKRRAILVLKGGVVYRPLEGSLLAIGDLNWVSTSRDAARPPDSGPHWVNHGPPKTAGPRRRCPTG